MTLNCVDSLASVDHCRVNCCYEYAANESGETKESELLGVSSFHMQLSKVHSVIEVDLSCSSKFTVCKLNIMLCTIFVVL